MRLFYSLVAFGVATFAGALAAAFFHRWVLSAVLAVGFLIYLLLAPRVIKRVPDQTIKAHADVGQRITTSMGRAVSGGWTPRQRGD